MKISVIAPVKNEVPWIGYSIMAVKDYVHEFIYTVAKSSDDGTIPLLLDLQKEVPNLKVLISEKYDFHPLNMDEYNASFNDAIAQSSGDACWFLHPDMLVTNPESILTMPSDALAWYVNMTSYAGDFQTVITKGRTDKWKSIHAKKYGLAYLGGYGSQNEDFYHQEITGKSHKHYGDDFAKYPFTVKNSGINVNHYCELKPYKRRLEKMKLCLRTLSPAASDDLIDEQATQHPRVTLEPSSNRFGEFKFEGATDPIPEVITKYKDRFESYSKEEVWLTR